MLNKTKCVLALSACMILGCGGERQQDALASNKLAATHVAVPVSTSTNAANAVKPSIAIGDIDKGSFCYAETINLKADVSDIKTAFRADSWLQTITAVYDRRWPSGKALAQAQANDQYFKGFVDTASFNKLAESLMVAIHEETHMWDLAANRTEWNKYTSAWVDQTFQFNKMPLHDGFARKEILPLIKDDASSETDKVYLHDANQGQYHLQGVTAELNASLMGLPAALTVAEFIDGIGASNSRDLALTNMNYLQLYLRIAKANYPQFWQKLKAEPDFKKFVLVQFLRTSYFIDLSTPWASKLGSSKVPALIQRVYAPENIAIMQELTGYVFPTSITDHCMGSSTPSAPSITSQPQSATVAVGQSVNFAVAASGTAPLSYQWRKNGVNIVGAANAPSFSIAAASSTDAGAYSVVVSNRVANVTSSSANLTVNSGSVTVTVSPATVNLQPGASQTFSAVVSGSSVSGVNWSVVEAGGGTITPAGVYSAPNQVGTYRVKAVSLADSSKFAQALITVSDTPSLPSITSQPSDLTLNLGNAASFAVSATGSAPLSYQWRKNGAAIAGATSASYSFTPVAADNGASFSVLVSNKNGSVSSRNALLTLNIPNNRELIVNGGFESGSSNWSGSTAAIGNFSSRGHPAFEGLNAAWLGGNGKTTSESLSQAINIAANASSANLSFQLAISTDEQANAVYDKLVVQVVNSSGTVLGTLASYSNLNASNGYQLRSLNMLPYKGQAVRLVFKMTEDAVAQTSFLVDKISLQVR